mgnify:CR=1 FL=1
MRLNELVDECRKIAEEVLRDPGRYDNRMQLQASILLQRNIEKALATLAKRNDGCISCANSKPHEKDPLNLMARQCELGKSGDTRCEHWKPILEK